MFNPEDEKKVYHVKFMRHLQLLIWKSYVQRIRRWPILVVQTLFSGILFLIAVACAKPVFMTPLQLTPQTPLSQDDILATLSADTHLGYAPDTQPYSKIMANVANMLNKTFMAGSSEQTLNEKLYEYEISKGRVLKHHVIWVIWEPKESNVWKFSIRSTELAHLASSTNVAGTSTPQNRHLRVGFLAVQMAVCEALLKEEATSKLRHQMELKVMPMSPLMQQERVQRALVWILLCYTLAFIPPVMEVAQLVVAETVNEYKRALVMRNVGAACLYLGWLAYFLITAFPILVLATGTLILIFRWVWVFLAFTFLVIYVTVMAMTAFIICMFHTKSYIAAIWTAFFTFLQLFLAELLVHHGFDGTRSFSIFLHILLPPLGLVHGLNAFALLQATGRVDSLENNHVYDNHTILLWVLMIFIYLGVLLMLQRTIGCNRAIGGQVSWRSIIFKQAEDKNKLHAIQNLSGNERDQLQEVDELVAKAISFNNVSKSIMGIAVVRRLTFDVYRREYTLLYGNRLQERALNMMEDLITGLTLPDDGTINILGEDMAALRKAGKSILNAQGMLGFCHRPKFLVGEFTVLETLQFFTQLSLWSLQDADIEEYMLRNNPKLCRECDLWEVQNERVRHLDLYYKAQLCWAIALILEPRIVFIQSFTDKQMYRSVIGDKIVKYRSDLTIVKLSMSTGLLEHADRVFLFDRKVVVFGGSPAFMFFKYGREYRFRFTFRAQDSLDNHHVEELIDQAVQIGGQVRAYVGSLLILRLPTTPTDKTAAFVKEVTEQASKYGITSLHISLPDSDEIFKRAINDSRSQLYTPVADDISDRALREISDSRPWSRKKSRLLNGILLKQIVWKYISFYIHYRLFLIITILSATVTGTIIGMCLSFQLNALGDTMAVTKLQHGEKMTVEALCESTTLVLKVYNTDDAMYIANAYAMSHTNAKEVEIKMMTYTALPYTERQQKYIICESYNCLASRFMRYSLVSSIFVLIASFKHLIMATKSMTEYLVLRAIDSPQYYVFMYAYGMDVRDEDGILNIQVLYSPIHHDTAAAARSLARVYMALIRFYTRTMDADIIVTDDPLVLDSTLLGKKNLVPPLVIHFMLIITIAHITLLPTMEFGFIRHVQSHAMNFSPARYWISLFCCDIVLYWALVFIITTVLICVMYWVAPVHFLHRDLIVIPFMLIMYGISCVPQAYLFSLGPSAALNSMSFVIFNIIFGEASVISQFIHGDAFSYAERALSLSPQYNVANAFMRITKIFVYNSECVIFNNKQLCKGNLLHKCCEKCGIMQPCFERISYLSRSGILDEILWTVYHGIIFSSLLALWEYRVLQRVWWCVRERWFLVDEPNDTTEESGAKRESRDVNAKQMQLNRKKNTATIFDTFGEHLLVDNISLGTASNRVLSGISFGLGKGEALALLGLSDHGRLQLCEILAGYKAPASGTAIAMSKWSLPRDPHDYSRQVSFSCFERTPLPPWMTVYDALWMIAVLRGVPGSHVDQEINNLLEALDLADMSEVNVFRLHLNERSRLNFAVAVIGAPPVLVLDEFTAYQNFSVKRAMFYILYRLRKQGHSLVISSASVESHLPVTHRLAILVNGRIVDVDYVDELVARYSTRGYTVVVHLKDNVDVRAMFGTHFMSFGVNDEADGLANVQIMDNLNYAELFSRMEDLQKLNDTVYSYVISDISLEYIFNEILDRSVGFQPSQEPKFWMLKFLERKKKTVDILTLMRLQKFQKKYDIASLKELPWSVIFRR